MWKLLLYKIGQSFEIFKYTGFRKFRASQLTGRVIYAINNKDISIEGRSVWSMIKEIVIDDSYHLKMQNNPKNIIDVGANIGIFSIHAATLFPNCTVYAFEPVLDNFNTLNTNTKPLSNVITVHKALSNYAGNGYISNDLDNTAIKVYAEDLDHNLVRCETTTLDIFRKSNSIDVIDILKLDCEGAEYDILKVDLSFIRQIVGEFHVIEGKDLNELKTDLINQNFEINEWNIFPQGNAGLFWAINKNL